MNNFFRALFLLIVPSIQLIFAKDLSEKTCVIFIHGTINVSALKRNPLKLINRRLDKEDLYYHQTKAMRYEKEYIQFPMSSAPGLVAIKLTDSPQNTPELFAHLSEKTWQVVNPGQEREYYMFNWSGILSERERIHAALDLYKSLFDLYKKSLTENIKLKFYIIAHSHGGNVALSMAHHTKENLFNINNLVLLGSPISNQSIKNAQSEFFEHVYNIYSKGDWVQTFDFSVPGWALRTEAHFKGRAKSSYDINVFIADKTILKNSKKTILYGHSELASIDWKNLDRKIPILFFAPILTTYNALVMQNIKHEFSIIILDNQTSCFSFNNNIFKTDISLYHLYHEIIKEYALKYNLFGK